MNDTEPLAGSTSDLDSGPATSDAIEANHAHEQESQGKPQQEPRPAADGDGPLDITATWLRLREALAKRIQPEQYETWFRRSALVRVTDATVVLAVQNEFAREWIGRYYREMLEHAVSATLGGKRRIDIVIDSELTLEKSEEPASEENGHSAHGPFGGPAAPAPAPAGRADGPGRRGDEARSSSGLLVNSDVVLNPKYTFDKFVVGPCNRFGHAAAMGAGEAPGKTYNPFFLHGQVGVGKTHLLQSLCYLILERFPDYRILYLSCETFVNHFISALENGDLTEFRNKYRNVDVLVVDDIHLLANKERTQEEFFHTFNTLYNNCKQIVLSSDSPPKDIPTLQERLVSRFKWGMVTEIEPPCYETRMAIVKRKSRERSCELPDDVAQLIAEHVTRNVRELEGAVTRLIGYGSLTGKRITPELAREALQDIFVVHRGQPSMNDIVSIVTEHYGVKLSDLQSKKRTNSIAFPRQISMFLARKVTNHSLEEIGGFFGGRDHSTVLHGVNKIMKLTAEKGECHSAVDGFLRTLHGAGLEA